MTKLGFKMVVIDSKDIQYFKEELKTLRSKHSLNDDLNSRNQCELKIKLARASADKPFKVVIYYVSILLFFIAWSVRIFTRGSSQVKQNHENSFRILF